MQRNPFGHMTAPLLVGAADVTLLCWNGFVPCGSLSRASEAG